MACRSGQSYSADLREGVLAAVDGGLPATAVAERFGVSLSFIDKALKRRRLTGETAARAQRNQQELKLAAYHETIQAEIVRRPDVTLDSLRAWLVETHGVESSLGLMHNTLIRLGLTLKKSRTGSLAGPWGPRSPTAEEQDRPDVTEQRATWRAEQAAMSRGRLIFIDETGASTKMARRYGRSLRGRRLDAALPHGHWKTTTFIGGLTSRGFLAPYVLDGAMDGPTFRAWTEQMLAPQLEPATSLSWTIYPPTRSPPTRSKACARRSRPRGRYCATCHPTHPTSTHRRPAGLRSDP
jgi:transposase